MVNLTITPHRGNGARTFPSTGYLGLTPVSLAGVVRVKIEEDLKTVQASSLVVRVRCYENIGGNHGSTSASTSASTSDKVAYSSSSSSSNVAGYHSSSCLGSTSTGYSLTDILKGTSSSSTPSSSNPSASPSSGGSKGRVLYEKSITMWTPPAPTTPAASQRLSSRSPSSSQSEGEERQDGEGDSPHQQQHAYPPRRHSHTEAPRTNSAQYGTLGEFTKAWRIVIPPEAIRQGAKSTMVFKNWKIWWAVEAVISHRPQGIHGDRIVKSHQLALLSYAPRSTSAIAPEWISSPLNNHPLSYHITSPTSTFGSSDPVEFHVQLTKKSHEAETPKKVTLELRREIVFGPTNSETPTSPTYNTSFESSTSSSSQSNTKKRVAHSRSNSGNLLNLLPSATNSRHKSESQEALIITTPPLSNTSSTLSSFSTLMPSTPPAFSPTYEKIPSTTPAEYADSVHSESYFGSFNGESTASRKGSMGDLSQPKHAAQHARFSSPAPPVILSAPPSSSSYSKRNINSSKKEDITLATFEADCLFTSPTWNGKITGNMPKVKSLYHYALGETCQTPSQSTTTNPHAGRPSSTLTPLSGVAGGASSRYYLIPRIHYKNKNTFIELPPVDILFYAISVEERTKAIEMIPKIDAIQKAEAKLFGGDEIVSKSSVEKNGKKLLSNMPSHPASVHHIALPGHKTATTSAAPRPRTSHSVSPTVGTGKSAHPLPALKLPEALNLETGDAIVRLSTIRRRSEHTEDFLDCPRTRQRFASIPDLSPIVGSPCSDALSPSLSGMSNSTSRPRSTFKSRPTTATSSRSNGTKPRTAIRNAEGSSAGVGDLRAMPLEAPALDMLQSASQSSSDTPFVVPSLDSASSPSTRTSSASGSSMDLSPEFDQHNDQSTKSPTKSYTYGSDSLTPASVNGLFAHFSGFSLRPPEAILAQVPLIREDVIAPKATSPSSSNSRQSNGVSLAPTVNNHKRKSAELLAAPGPAKMSPSKSSSGSSASGSSSSLVFLHEVTLASPPSSDSINPNNVSRTHSKSGTMQKAAAHNTSPDTLSPLVDITRPSSSVPNARRSKGGMSGAFSFFRRSSARI